MYVTVLVVQKTIDRTNNHKDRQTQGQMNRQTDRQTWLKLLPVRMCAFSLIEIGGFTKIGGLPINSKHPAERALNSEWSINSFIMVMYENIFW